MAASSHNKQESSVDSVHTLFGLTKPRPARSSHAKNKPKQTVSTQFLEVMSGSFLLPMKRCRPTTTYRTSQERNA